MIYIGGCSISAGAGFDQGKDSTLIYPNILSSKLEQAVVNDAEGGSSNLKIFLRAAKALVDNHCDLYVIQWTAIHRHWLYPTPDSGLFIGTPMESGEDTKFIAEFQKRNHDYGNIMQLIDFCRILQDTAKTKNKKLIFINGKVDITPDMTDRDLPHTEHFDRLLSDLQRNQRDEFAEQLINNFELVDWEQWVNPWNSVASMQIDNAPLDQHPGPATHKKIADMINQRIDTQRENT
jgi:hypothetical protein